MGGYKGRGCLDMCEIGDTECLFIMIHFHILILRHGPFLLPRTLFLSFLSSHYLSFFSLVPSFCTPVTLWLQLTLNQYPPHLTPALEIELRISHMLDRPFTTVLQPQPWARFSQVSWDLVLLFALPWAMVEPLEVEDLIHL